MVQFRFSCPYCGSKTVITDPSHHSSLTRINTRSSKYGDVGLFSEAVSCPNEDCRELTLTLRLSNVGNYEFPNMYESNLIETFNLLPRSHAKPQPDYVPEAIREDYYEACAIASDSPKAAAALSRRCLQGILRDFWDIPANKRGNLGAEINFVKEKVEDDIWESIQTVRSVGDIGAHMEKDVNTIIEVDVDEALLLIELIETLISDWYIARRKRSERSSRLREIAKDKLDLKRAAKLALVEKEESV